MASVRNVTREDIVSADTELQGMLLSIAGIKLGYALKCRNPRSQLRARSKEHSPIMP